MTSDNSKNLPVREIPGGYGLPFLGPIADRYDFFYNQGADEFFRSRKEKYKSSVFRCNMPPGPFIAKNPKVVVLLDSVSFPILFDVSKVEKRDIFAGTYMASTKFTGGYRVLSFLYPSEPKHATIIQTLAKLHDRKDYRLTSAPQPIRPIVPAPVGSAFNPSTKPNRICTDWLVMARGCLVFLLCLVKLEFPSPEPPTSATSGAVGAAMFIDWGPFRLPHPPPPVAKSLPNLLFVVPPTANRDRKPEAAAADLELESVAVDRKPEAASVDREPEAASIDCELEAVAADREPESTVADREPESTVADRSESIKARLLLIKPLAAELRWVGVGR
nr:allene oxide synthase [Ipomoea batatas]